MTSWCLHEGSLYGREGRMWTLSPDKELLVGRGAECGVIVQVSEARLLAV